MKKIVLLLILFNGIVFSKDILLLHSYHKGYEWSDAISKAIEENFSNTDVEITTEYMDTKHIFTPAYIHNLSNLYKQRYKDRSFDLIIASDNNALEFLEQYHKTLFTDTPIVFCGINNFDELWFQNAKIKNRTTGIVEAVDIEKNLELILKLHPKLSKLYVINDTTTTGLSMKKEFFEAVKKYEDKLTFEYVDQFKLNELQQNLKKLDKESVILFMLLFKDETGKRFTFKDGLTSIEKSTDTPIYGLWDFYLPYGLVGGFLTHGYAQGDGAARLAKEILEGYKAKDLEVIKKSPNRYIFDYNQLSKFNIHMSAIPENAIIKNKPFSFYETYKSEIYTVLSIFILCIVIIVILILLLLQKRKAKNQFQIQLQFIETLLNTIKNPIFYKDKQGHYVGCNEAFCEFIGQSKDQIIGKTMYDFFESQSEFVQVHKKIEEQLFAGENPGEYTIEYVIPEKENKIMLVDKSLYYDLRGDINGVLTILHDITELVEIEKEKKKNESFMVQQSKLAEIGEMISAIAHQWNEPLVEISAIVQDLQLQHQTAILTKKDIDSFVNESMVQIQYMSKTLKDFRDFLKPSVKKSHFNIQDAFDEVMNILERQIKYSYIELSIDYKSKELKVYGYKNEFMQVLITILNNAKDAILKMRKMEKDYPGFIQIVVEAKEDIIYITIKDNGCGVKEINKEKVFEPYFSTKSKGNGLGLYMSKVLICEKMDGEIYFNDDKEFTTLTISLPMDRL